MSLVAVKEKIAFDGSAYLHYTDKQAGTVVSVRGKCTVTTDGHYQILFARTSRFENSFLLYALWYFQWTSVIDINRIDILCIRLLIVYIKFVCHFIQSYGWNMNKIRFWRKMTMATIHNAWMMPVLNNEATSAEYLRAMSHGGTVCPALTSPSMKNDWHQQVQQPDKHHVYMLLSSPAVMAPPTSPTPATSKYTIKCVSDMAVPNIRFEFEPVRTVRRIDYSYSAK